MARYYPDKILFETHQNRIVCRQRCLLFPHMDILYPMDDYSFIKMDTLYPGFIKDTRGVYLHISRGNDKLDEILKSCSPAGFPWHDNCHNVASKDSKR